MKKLAARFEERQRPTPVALDTPSDRDSKDFVDLNFKVPKIIRDKHWQESAMRSISKKKLYLMAMQAFYEKNGSLIERASPEFVGIEQAELELSR